VHQNQTVSLKTDVDASSLQATATYRTDETGHTDGAYHTDGADHTDGANHTDDADHTRREHIQVRGGVTPR